MSDAVSRVNATAKLVRKALKASFPNTEFRVLPDVYAGGASIYVSWIDGPYVAQVDRVVQAFAGSTSDRTEDSRDLKNQDHLGQHKSTGSGVDFVLTDRQVSELEYAKVVNAVCKHWGVDPGTVRLRPWKSFRFEGQYIGGLANDVLVPNAGEYLGVLIHRHIQEEQRRALRAHEVGKG